MGRQENIVIGPCKGATQAKDVRSHKEDRTSLDPKWTNPSHEVNQHATPEDNPPKTNLPKSTQEAKPEDLHQIHLTAHPSHTHNYQVSPPHGAGGL
eukprot:6229798-Amphidinium_carterae.2